jgi:hypothetical protein
MDHYASAQELNQCIPHHERERSDSAETVAYCHECSHPSDSCECVHYADVTPLSVTHAISHIPPYTDLWCLSCNVVGACICQQPDPSQAVPLLAVKYPFKMPLTGSVKLTPHPLYQYVVDCLLAGLLEEFYLPMF